jgi:hypothetical protein
MSQLFRRLCIASVALGAAAACSHPQPHPAPAPSAPSGGATIAPTETKPPVADPYAAIDEAGKAITADILRDQIAKLSSDEFEGRGPTTKGDIAARAWLVEQLKAMGYEPGGGDNQWQQPVDLVGIRSEMPPTWSFARGGKSLALKWSDQYIAGGGTQSERAAIKAAEVVFVGYGIQTPEYG